MTNTIRSPVAAARHRREQHGRELRHAVGRVANWLTAPQGQRWILRLLLVYAGVGFCVWIQRPGDFAGYVVAGQFVLSGRHIYLEVPSGVNTWPPFFSVLCVPLALLARPSPYLARGMWLLLNFGCLLLVLRLIARLVYGRTMSLRAGGAGLSLAAPELLVPLLLSDRYVSGNFDHLQINLILFTLVLGGLALQARQRHVLGGLALGCAVATKVMAVLFIPYLAYRRRWRAAACTTAAAAVFSLSPILVFGWQRFWDYVTAWCAVLATGWGVGEMNQSVFAMWDRLIGHGMAPLGVAAITYVPASGSLLVEAAHIGSLLVIAGLALWSFRAEPRDRWSELAEWSVVFIVAALFGPVCWKAYLAVLLLPNTVLFAAVRSARVQPHARRVIGTVLLVSFLMGGLTSPGLIGKELAGRLEMASVPTVSWLILLGGLLWFGAHATEYVGRSEPSADDAGGSRPPAGGQRS